MIKYRNWPKWIEKLDGQGYLGTNNSIVLMYSDLPNG